MTTSSDFLHNEKRLQLESLARQLRSNIVLLSQSTRTPHIGSCLSCADILLAVCQGGLNISPERSEDPARDRLVFSKGHCAAALCCALAQRGFFSQKKLAEVFNRNGGLQEHPNYRCIPGVENASGSLGHGLSLGVGMALAARIMDMPYRVCVIMGDGECNEGSIWEAAMLAGARKIANLCAVVDLNGWQATGRSREVMALEPLSDKWRAFGWDVLEVDGHSPYDLREILRSFGSGECPLAIIARTVKGKGVSFMEDDNNWHYRIPNDEEMRRIKKELASA